MLHIVYIAVCVGAGFAAGRVKNAAKLAAVSAYVAKCEAEVGHTFDSVVVGIKARL